MCGIVGWVSQATVDRGVLEDMRDAMIHRGPDGQGTWFSDDEHVGFGHRRLSIIDLSTVANQPMVDSTGRAVIVFNGEIYNHRELRSELEDAGMRFHTDHSDTECLLNGYLCWGLDGLLERLIGMFAFAIHDISTRRIHLVRDRVGIKPFYFWHRNGSLVFASETKALLRHPDIPSELNHESLYHHLSFRSPPPGETMFEGIKCLKAAELMTWDLDKEGIADKRIWWDPLEKAGNHGTMSNAEAVSNLEQVMHSAVQLRMESDVPIGLFLSGGLDSAYILSQMTGSTEPVSTFTVNYPGFSQYNEDHIARELAESAETQHHEVPLCADDFAAGLTRVAYYLDEPIAAPICLPVFALSESARDNQVKVVLGGDGSDELLIGYNNWMSLRDATKWNQMVPSLPGTPLRKLALLLAAKMASPSSRAVEMMRRVANRQPMFWGGSMEFTESEKPGLLGPNFQNGDYDTYEHVVRPLYADFCQRRDPRDVTAWMSYIDLKYRLPQLMLPRFDKMGMAFSIEGRVPFLDHRFIELVLGLAPTLRGGSGRESKSILKQVAAKHLPRDVVYRKKQGFQAPVKEWRDTVLGDRYIQQLRQFCDVTGLFERSTVDKLLNRKDDRLYFSLINFMLWFLLFIDNVVDDDMVSSIRQNPTPLAARS